MAEGERHEKDCVEETKRRLKDIFLDHIHEWVSDFELEDLVTEGEGFEWMSEYFDYALYELKAEGIITSCNMYLLND